MASASDTFFTSLALYKKKLSHNLDQTLDNVAYVKMHYQFPETLLTVSFTHCSYKCTVSFVSDNKYLFWRTHCSSQLVPCRRQTLRPAESWSQPAGSSNSVPTSGFRHTSTHSPSRQPAVRTWQTLQQLAKEDLYLVFDLLEFASILVKERACFEGERKVREIPGPPLMHQDDGTG